jgi:tetratricopeptide (TPR) repeat protein
VLTHLLPGVIQRLQVDPALLLAELSWRLHQAMANPGRAPLPPEHSELRKLWAILWTIRRAARRYLFDPGDLSEYYQGLTLYLLGALRYKSLSEQPEHPLPKRLAFWGAALAYYWLLHPDAGAPAALASLLEHSRPLWADHAPHTNGSVGDVLAVLPAGQVPPGGVLPSGSRMPLERNSRFVGRLAELERLAAGLRRADLGSAAPALAVAGLGGIGKTQLACEFAFRFGRFFSGGVFWLACADPEVLAAEVAACGERGAMNLRPNFRELPLEQQVQLVLAEWRKPIPRLLIFDNCEAPELLERWLPHDSGCHALITSRRADWAALGIPTLALDVLPRVDSLALLQWHQPDADSELLGEIAHEVGDLPLALHLAGSYLARYRHNTDAAGYLAGLRQAPPLSHQSLQNGVLSPTEHDLNVARTFALSYDQLDHDDPITLLARRLIQYAACLAPGTPIPESLVRLALATHYANAAHIVRDGFELGSAIDQLVELGLARAEADHTLWFHRLVVAYTRERLGDELEPTQALVERGLCIEVERLNAQRDLAPLRGWQAHLRFVADTALPRGDVVAADLCHALAEHLYQTGDYAGARAYHEQALSIREMVLGAHHPATASSLTEIGKALLFYGDVVLAQPYLERALAIQQAKLGDHEDAATTLNHLGFLFQRQNQLAEARQYHEQALRMRRSVLGAEHPAVVESLCNLAYVEYAQGYLDVAHAFLQHALSVQRKATGDDHPETGRVLTNIGELLLVRGQLSEAGSVLAQALAIQERELGADHPETARTLGDLGDVRRLSGDIVSARWFYERALNIFQICHGTTHFRTKRVQAQLAALSSSEPGSSSYTYPRSSGHY